MSDDKGGQATIGSEQSTGTEPVVSINEFPVDNWDRYEFHKCVGRGGMGAVYKARDRRLGRIVALKFIRGGDEKLTQRFLQEARAQLRIDHPGICKIYEVGEVAGKAYIAMQFVYGMPLEQAASSLSLLEKVEVIKNVAEAMHAAHELGVIHRDIKPANIMVDRLVETSGTVRYRPVVMDFGLAREAGDGKGLTESGAVLGTPAYMSPEQARGDVRHMDRRTDVYGLGATLYDLQAGSPPFDGETVIDIILKVLSDEAPPLRQKIPSIPGALDTIISKCLNKEPQQRYATAQELADDLGRFLSNQRILGKKVSLWYRLRRRAQQNKPLVVACAALMVSLLSLVSYGIFTRVQNNRKAGAAKQQAELAQRLGQEISKMEWLLRSARQLPLHDLGREKVIVRSKMSLLQQDLDSYGALSRGLAHYALGRGHLALHEYPEALSQLQLALSLGHHSADVHYALGLALGKHYEIAMHEARLAGGGEWANKQLKDIAPKYLSPAIASLQQSRAMQSDAPSFLDALIAFYQRDFDLALKKAKVAELEAPWLYEAAKLRGDIHEELALRAHVNGKQDESVKEFAAAVQSYQVAAAVGQSDAEVYEGLAETWVRQIEMALIRGQSTEAAYAAAVEASDKLTQAEPTSITGRMEKAYASLMTMALTGAGLSSEQRVKQCLTEATAVLGREPENPYARDVAAACITFAADVAQGKGEDPEPLLRKALGLLEPAIEKNPHFLWGLNDLACVNVSLGIYLQLRGKHSARTLFEKAIAYEAKAMALDDKYLSAFQNSLYMLTILMATADSETEIRLELARADEYFAMCLKANSQFQQCHINYFIIYALAAQRTALAGADPQPRLKRALETLTTIRNLSGKFLDLEQYSALAHLIAASDRVYNRQNPDADLLQFKESILQCLALAEKDPMCKTLAVRGEWVAAGWATQQNKPVGNILRAALQKAEDATQSPAIYPDAWQVLAEVQLRLVQAETAHVAARHAALTAGLAATDKVFAINPNHALGRATQGALELQRAQLEKDPAQRQAAAQAAVKALRQAMESDPLLAHDYAPLLAQAQSLSAAH